MQDYALEAFEMAREKPSAEMEKNRQLGLAFLRSP